MKNKSFSGKYILYVIIFMVTAIVTFISMHYKTESAASVLMSEATLPVVMAKTEAGTLYNAMHGYTCEVDYSRLSTDLTLLPSDKKLAIAIDTYGESVSSISYKSEIQEICRLSRVRKLKTLTVHRQEWRLCLT